MAEFHELAGYNVIETLGYGAKSTIYSVRDPQDSSKLYALKRVVKNGAQEQRFLDQAIAEHEIAENFDHPSLRKSIKLIKQRKLIKVSEVLVLMELVIGKTMEERSIKDLNTLCMIGIEVAKGLQHMHDKGFVHADIKPNNIMLVDNPVLTGDGDSGRVKLIDFGQSCAIGAVKQRIQGTPDYIAPEQVKRQAITPKTDIFNWGATLYFLIAGEPIPTMMTGKGSAGELRTKKKAGDLREYRDDVSPALSTLVMSCIERNPMDRPTSMIEVADRLAIAREQIIRASRAAKASSDSAGSNDGDGLRREAS